MKLMNLCVCAVIFIVIACSPYSFWRVLVKNFYQYFRLQSWDNLIESTTIYHLFFNLQKLSLTTKNYFHYTEPKFIYAHDEQFYRSLIRDVIHIYKSRSTTELPTLLRTPRVPSQSERNEALQSLHAASIYQSSRQFSKAQRLLEHAFSLDPDNTKILIALGEVIEASLVHEKSQTIQVLPLSNSLIAVHRHTNSHENSDALVLAAEHLYTKALIVDPTAKDACTHRRRLTPIVEEIDQRLFNTIDLKLRRFYHIPENNPGLRQAKVEHYFRHIYHSNAIEGNTLTLAQTRSILETRLAVGGKSLMEQNEVLGLDSALRYINNTLLRGRLSSITLDIVLELHRHLLSFVDLREAGYLRRTQVYIADHHPPPPESLFDLMNELVAWINSDEVIDMHPIELAALTHWKLVFIHPFYDGNGRTARLLMNLILMRAGLPPAIIKLEDRPAYYELLKTANDGDVRPFIRFIASCTERTIDEYLAAAMPDRTDTTEVTRIDMNSLVEEFDKQKVSIIPSPALSSSLIYEPKETEKYLSNVIHLVDAAESRKISILPRVIYLGGVD